MLILKLAYNDELDFVEDLQELREMLKKKDVVIGLVESIEGSTHIIRVICDEEYYSEKVKEIINLYVSNVLYKIVIENYRQKEMLEFLTDNYFFLKQSEIIEVEDKIIKILKCEENVIDEDSIYCLNRINSIIEKIKECICEKQEININGFIIFRMRMLRDDIEKIIDKIVSKYMVEKEYKEFVKLLKYFVEIQESKIDTINIYIEEGNNYEIKDNSGNDLYENFLSDLTNTKSNNEINCEDILISGLITNAPKIIKIYNKNNCTNKEFLDTIENVFGERVIYSEDSHELSHEKIISKNVDIY